ncbi:hypothetical protein SE91_26325 [Bradyrhizobium sp. DOA1]|nr:hypothetical protein SE91_26325 [Bradyrhizobium sp. DOA1]
MQRNHLSHHAEVGVQTFKLPAHPIERLMNETFDWRRSIKEPFKSSLHDNAVADSGPARCNFETAKNLFGKLDVNFSRYGKALLRRPLGCIDLL